MINPREWWNKRLQELQEQETMRKDMEAQALEQADRIDELAARRKPALFNWSDDEGA